MKKACISFLVCIIIILSAVGLILPTQSPGTEYLRIHVRADSNEESAQLIKYKVKDAVVEYLTPIIAELDTKEKAEKRLRLEIDAIENVANEVLKNNGFDYTCNADIKREEFPTRVYGELTLEQGFYDALILELGSGKGDNWWCVVYPPLCFTGQGTGYKYQSKIYQIIQQFIQRKKEGK